MERHNPQESNETFCKHELFTIINHNYSIGDSHDK